MLLDHTLRHRGRWAHTAGKAHQPLVPQPEEGVFGAGGGQRLEGHFGPGRPLVPEQPAHEGGVDGLLAGVHRLCRHPPSESSGPGILPRTRPSVPKDFPSRAGRTGGPPLFMPDQIRCVHTNGQDYGRVDVAKAAGRLRPEQLDHLRTFVSTVFETGHPVVRTHPETGETALLLGGFAQRVVGHPTSESTDILRTLQSYIIRPENTVRWHWHAGDVVVWDTRSTQHYALYDYGSAHRRVQRVTIAGGVPVGLDGVPSVALQGDATRYYQPG